MDAETYTLAPSVVVEKARRLYDAGLYKQALDMLMRNQVVVDVYPTHVEMRLAKEMNNRRRDGKTEQVGFLGGWRIGRHFKGKKRKE